MKVRGRSAKEQQVLQAAVDGAPVSFFQQELVEAPSSAVEHDWFALHDTAHGCNILHWAAGMGHLHLVEYFLKDCACPVDSPAVGNSQGRTALHYACRNGYLSIAQLLVHKYGANVNPQESHHGVTPFHLAVWRNQFAICQWLVDECHVDPTHANAFQCTAIHWLGLVPQACLSNGNILHLAEWLSQRVDVYAAQQQNHSVLHKAAWGGHLVLCQYFHENFGMYDDTPDDAGNYAADLADMAGHAEISAYLRRECSADTVRSCTILGLSMDQRYDRRAIQRAYHVRARALHPDRIAQQQQQPSEEDVLPEFVKLTQAYKHLIDEDGVGRQSNPKHSLPLLLKATGEQESNASETPRDITAGTIVLNETTHHGDNNRVNADDDETLLFAAQLRAVVLEYGEKGLDLSNLRKKWKQVWPAIPFPAPKEKSLKTWIQRNASHIVKVETNAQGITRVYNLH